MTRFPAGVTFRIAFTYGILVVSSMAIISAVFYLGTVGVRAREIDAKLQISARNLANGYAARGRDGLQKEIQQLLIDGIDQDTEVYLLIRSDGTRLAGNLTAQPTVAAFDTLTTQSVMRYGRPSTSRLIYHRLPDGAMLVVGWDLHDQQQTEALVWRSLSIGGTVALLLAVIGALLFGRQLGDNIAAIRRTALDIQAGELSRRIPLGPVEDEFTRLGRDINHMLDRIEQLMDGVRHISNNIAHNLRTPLGRIRGQLDESLRGTPVNGQVVEAARYAIQEIDALILVFEKLLQIAEAESGTRRQTFQPVPLESVVTVVTELYDAMLESQGISFQVEIQGNPVAFGDKDLLAVALANLVENAMKYAPESKFIHVAAIQEGDVASLLVQDQGPGIPAYERTRVIQRFYRLKFEVPGSGLGLSIVAAIAHLHRGTLQLEDADPGLRARMVLSNANTH